VGRRWLLTVAALVAGLMAGAVLVNNLLRRVSPLPSIQQLTLHPGEVTSARFAPDGRTVLFAASWNGEPPRIYSTTVGNPEYHPLGVDDARLVAVSPAGEVAVLLHPNSNGPQEIGTLALVPGVGGSTHEVATDVNSGDWAPNGASMAIVRHSGTKSQLEFPVGHLLLESDHNLAHVRVSPKGDLVAALEGRAGNVILVDALGQKRILLAGWVVSGLAWGASGGLWVSGGPSDDAADAFNSLWTISLAGQARLAYRSMSNLVLEDISAGGRILARQYSDWTGLGVLRLVDKSLTDNLAWLDDGFLGGLSEDGTFVLFSQDESYRQIGQFAVYLRRTDGSPPVRLGEGRGVALSSDKKWIIAVRPGQWSRLWLVPTGAGPTRSVDFPGIEFAPIAGQFLRDGKRAVLLARKDSAIVALVVDLETRQYRVVTPPLSNNSFFLAVSPDERFVAAVPSNGVVTAYSVDGGPPKAFPDLGQNYTVVGWAKDGLLLHEGGMFGGTTLSMIQFNTETGVQRLLTHLQPRESTGRTLVLMALASQDGKSVAYTYSHSQSALFVLDFGRDPP
jgi:WD40 repeat protein